MSWTIEKLKIEFEKRGVKLLETEYKGVDTPMLCIAKCGHEKKLSLSNLLIGHGLYCRKCSYGIGSSKRKFDYDYIKHYFEEEGCELLNTEYMNCTSQLKYIARCGHENTVSFHKFSNGKQGRLCRLCCKPRKEKHHKYNPNLTDEERIYNRDYYALDVWRIDIFKRDKYTCKQCGDDKGHNLNAHHINGYNWDIDNRLKIDNGITLCDICHLDFHKLYGYGNNTIEQFKEWFDGNTEVIL